MVEGLANPLPQFGQIAVFFPNPAWQFVLLVRFPLPTCFFLFSGVFDPPK
jgi:hypothetical protein